MIQTLNPQDLSVLLEDYEPPCVSLYQPTHRSFPENEQDLIRFRNLTRKIEENLSQSLSRRKLKEMMEPLHQLGDDNHFWQHAAEGLAVVRANGMFRAYKLQQRVPELAVVSDTFHIKPLLRILQAGDRYQVLALARDHIRLLEGSGAQLQEVELAEGVPRTLTEALGEELTPEHMTVASYGGLRQPGDMHHGHGGRKEEQEVDEERFFRVVDRTVAQHHSQPSGLPLILAAPAAHQGHFRRISRNPKLLAKGIEHDAASMSLEEMGQAAWMVMEPERQARVQRATEQFAESSAKGMAAQRLSEIGRAAIQSRIQTLLVEADRNIPGRLDRETGDIARSRTSDGVDDLLDDLAESVLRHGGEVIVAPREVMPGDSGAAAIFRF